MKPKTFDRGVMDILFGSKISLLRSAVKDLHKAREVNQTDDLVQALENLEDQITVRFDLVPRDHFLGATLRWLSGD